MSDIKTAYGASNQALACTITSLANSTTGAGRASTAIDNTTNKPLDILLFGKVKTSASALANDKTVYLHAYATADGGTTYTDGITGTDAAFTATVDSSGKYPALLVPIRGVYTPAVSTTYSFGPFSLASCFGGALPDHVGVFVLNMTGQALDASVGSLWWQYVYATSV